METTPSHVQSMKMKRFKVGLQVAEADSISTPQGKTG